MSFTRNHKQKARQLDHVHRAGYGSRPAPLVPVLPAPLTDYDEGENEEIKPFRNNNLNDEFNEMEVEGEMEELGVVVLPPPLTDYDEGENEEIKPFRNNNLNDEFNEMEVEVRPQEEPIQIVFQPFVMTGRLRCDIQDVIKEIGKMDSTAFKKFCENNYDTFQLLSLVHYNVDEKTNAIKKANAQVFFNSIYPRWRSGVADGDGWPHDYDFLLNWFQNDAPKKVLPDYADFFKENPLMSKTTEPSFLFRSVVCAVVSKWQENKDVPKLIHNFSGERKLEDRKKFVQAGELIYVYPKLALIPNITAQELLAHQDSFIFLLKDKESMLGDHAKNDCEAWSSMD